MDLSKQRICVTGGAGFLGRHVCRCLMQRGLSEDQMFVPRSDHYDLTRQADVQKLYSDFNPSVVIHLAADVGGIGANRAHPGRFFYANMVMGLNMIEQARQHGLEKFVFAGTICSYPAFTAAPFQEQDLWNGYPEPTNAPYGVAKKALMVMLNGYHEEYGLKSAVVMPVNLYGPGDNFHPESSHVIPAMIRRFLEAQGDDRRTVTCWGSGEVSREFLYVEDAAEAIVRAAQRLERPDPINLGTGKEITIKALADKIAALCAYEGAIEWDRSKPDGQQRRCLDTRRAAEHLEWQAHVNLDDGLKRTIEWWLQQTVEVGPS